ncbi:hypothetical protein AXF42_Ash018199 [Apostasia shenzhenica]|uniref:Uncharacterized protein n=1 Tax=Apostasia shenzhenica TaxID=1088818 RepID=A0A2I0B1B4_9ASPA|nr:hypothetical protein AXF42_Ash018199 [Apostasia shenzhenica]
MSTRNEETRGEIFEIRRKVMLRESIEKLEDGEKFFEIEAGRHVEELKNQQVILKASSRAVPERLANRMTIIPPMRQRGPPKPFTTDSCAGTAGQVVGEARRRARQRKNGCFLDSEVLGGYVSKLARGISRFNEGVEIE